MHFKDILADKYGITVNYSFLYNFLNKNNIKSPRKHRKKTNFITEEIDEVRLESYFKLMLLHTNSLLEIIANILFIV